MKDAKDTLCGPVLVGGPIDGSNVRYIVKGVGQPQDGKTLRDQHPKRHLVKANVVDTSGKEPNGDSEAHHAFTKDCCWDIVDALEDIIVVHDLHKQAVNEATLNHKVRVKIRDVGMFMME